MKHELLLSCLVNGSLQCFGIALFYPVIMHSCSCLLINNDWLWLNYDVNELDKIHWPPSFCLYQLCRVITDVLLIISSMSVFFLSFIQFLPVLVRGALLCVNNRDRIHAVFILIIDYCDCSIFILLLFLVQVRHRTEVLCTPSSIRLGFELMTSRS